MDKPTVENGLSFEQRRQNWQHLSDSFKQTLVRMAMGEENEQNRELVAVTSQNHYLDIVDKVEHLSELNNPDGKA